MLVHSVAQDVLPAVKVGVAKQSFVRRHPALTFCLLGYTAGYAFWHYVGVWSFVGQFVAEKSTAEHIAQVQPKSTTSVAPPPQNIGLLTVNMTPANCTALLLDRAGGKPTAEPCPNEVMPLNSLRAARKEDRRIPVAEAKVSTEVKAAKAPTVPAVASWSARVAAPSQ